MLCLMDLTTQKNPDACSTHKEWALQVDRGGLCYVKTQQIYSLLQSRRKSGKALDV